MPESDVLKDIYGKDLLVLQGLRASWSSVAATDVDEVLLLAATYSINASMGLEAGDVIVLDFDENGDPREVQVKGKNHAAYECQLPDYNANQFRGLIAKIRREIIARIEELP